MHTDGFAPITVYIASSWKNAHGVELLTSELRSLGFEVRSWVENNFGETHNHVTRSMPFEEWVVSPESQQSFSFDTRGAYDCNIFIYYGPGGKDACAELGIAWATALFAKAVKIKKPILGLWAKGEDLGLMRKMIDRWFDRPHSLLSYLRENYPSLKK